ncbi:HlyD family efflux transporter periplasmic adaptor subunit [Bacillus sp. FJAT-49736]|uniref:efflux RND transporter periplasmic adaptor subunit n=1 Tax=Bacillus sp. FJAT-49736 TaxID=2833582 RepID=UPI001BCA0F8E|nr:HlyD family efflux transporter periplasmic adaptor subunit [Bacillus sp. FJAT-49736]MBS4174453.1 HlyD family efflux transporter periplasmic adaptor subunit [Bacillus sp. FJAT-49736]MBS4175810.1 HlyD family efflux transporter periplasmic adaptor subunit [Bacillus sp. FJAT-49736]
MNTKQKKKSKKKIVIWSIVGLLVLTIASLVLFAPKGYSNFEEENAQTGDITTYYSFSGAVEAKNRNTIISAAPIQIKEIKVKVGDKVQKGDVVLVTNQGEKFKSPLNGEISKIYIEKNAEIMSGAQLVDIVDYSALQTTVKVDEYDLKYLKVGQKVKVSINALEKDIQGTVSAISKEATNENGVSYFTATVDLHKDQAIRVGMSTEAKILKQQAAGVTTLSMKAIHFDSQNKPYVLIPSEKGMTTKKYIQTGINDGTTVEIKSGVEAGDVVMFSTKEDPAPMMMHGGN